MPITTWIYWIFPVSRHSLNSKMIIRYRKIKYLQAEKYAQKNIWTAFVFISWEELSANSFEGAYITFRETGTKLQNIDFYTKRAKFYGFIIAKISYLTKIINKVQQFLMYFCSTLSRFDHRFSLWSIYFNIAARNKIYILKISDLEMVYQHFLNCFRFIVNKFSFNCLQFSKQNIFSHSSG